MMATSKHLIKQQDEVCFYLVGDVPICSRGIPEIGLIVHCATSWLETVEIEPSDSFTLINAVFIVDSLPEADANHAKNTK